MSLNDTIRRAKSRLSEMVINETSLVDAAANLRKWVVTKNEGDMNGPAKKMTLKLPTAAKQALMDGLGQVIDKVTALASVVGDAETDDAAAVPEELSTALTQVGEMISGMATQYGGGASAAAGADQAPPTGAPSENGPPPNPNGGADQSKAQKGLPSEVHDGDNLKTLLHDGDSFKTLLHKSIAAAHLELTTLARLDKAGRKMAQARYKKLADLHDSLGKLLNELAYDESAESSGAATAAAAVAADAAKAKAPPPPPGKKPEEDDKPAPAAKADATEVAKAADGELKQALAEAQAVMKQMAARLEVVEKTAAAVSKAQGVSNGGSVDGPPPPAAEQIQWAPDMSEAVQKRKANGAAQR